MTTSLARRGGAAAVAVIAALALSSCVGDPTAPRHLGPAPEKLTGTVSLWHFFTDREAKVIRGVAHDFETLHPGVHVEIHEGQDDAKLQQVIASGGNVDVALSYSSDIVGNFCTSGAFQNLGPYVKRDHVDLSDIPDVVRDYTQYDGVRCTMPLLADISALYMNTDALKAAGITSPPTTLDELEADALKMTTYKADGSIKTLGFNPVMGAYENSPTNFAPATGARYLKADLKADVATPEWAALMKWQRAFVKKIGWQKLNAFTSGLGQEFSADNAFQSGQVAMQLDGEWRTAFIADQKPKLKYSTAPFPAADGFANRYGSGSISGNVLGIGRGSSHPELAWALIKYLSTDTGAVVKLANGLKNVPTVTSALNSPDLVVSPQYRTFIDLAKNPKTQSRPSSPLGGGYGQPLNDYWVSWQSRSGPGLHSGLESVAKQMNDSLALATVN